MSDVMKLGRKPLPRDDRDYPVSRLLEAVPAALGLSKYWWMGGSVMRLDQGATSTCEGNAWTEWLINGPITHPDFPSFDNSADAEAYAQGLYLDATGDATLQEGAYTRQILEELLKRGLIGAYYRCSTVDELLLTLTHVGPVCMGSSWFNSMFDPVEEFGNSYLRVDEASGIAGGHEYVLTGVNTAPTEGPPFARMENSWGSGWGHNGTARISIPDLHTLFVGDCFIVTEKVF